METKSLRPVINVITIFSVSTLLLIFTVDVSISDEAGVFSKLPPALGDWQGEEIFFCHSRNCGRNYSGNEVLSEGICNNCGKELHDRSLGEFLQMPKDTTLVKMRFVNQVTHEQVHASIVLSGKDRASIHRPEVCLRGQANDVKRELFIDVPLEGRKPLQVKILELERVIPDLPPGQNIAYQYYAYWFVGKDRETARHGARMFWMGYDRIVRNVAHQWAYISVSGLREKEGIEYHAQIRDFLEALYPKLIIDPEAFAVLPTPASEG
ncbi:MAG: hypothetical protein ACI9TH_002908 [Kiritimatiellia bacterium]|jgi:hypothetical protein